MPLFLSFSSLPTDKSWLFAVLGAGAFIFLLGAPLATSHSGQNLTVDVDGFRVVLDQNDDTVLANMATGFTAFLVDLKTNEALPNVLAWIRVSRGNEVLFASGQFITGSAGGVAVSFMFPSEDRYEISVAFKINNKNISAKFPLTVGQPDRIKGPWEDPAAGPGLVAGLLGLVLGIILKPIMFSKKPKSKGN